MRNSRSILGRCLILASLLCDPTCLAQNNAREARLLRLAPATDQFLRTARLDTAWTAAYSIGAAHTELDGDGHVFNTPASLVLTRGPYTITFATDGYTRVSPENLDGLSDILVIGGKTLWADEATNRNLSATLGFSLPTGGDVGSEKSVEFVSVAYSFAPGNGLNLTTSAKLYRDEAAASADENPYSQTLGLLLTRALSADRSLFFQFLSSHANGADWDHTVVAGYDFPLGKTSASFAISHGLSSDANDTTLEFGISW